MIRIYGEGEDQVVIESDRKTKGIVLKQFEEELSVIIDETLEVLVGYDGPCWGFSFSQLHEGEVPWPVSLDTESDNSLVVEIKCDEDTPWEVNKCSLD